MKKILLVVLLLTVALSLALTSCETLCPHKYDDSGVCTICGQEKPEDKPSGTDEKPEDKPSGTDGKPEDKPSGEDETTCTVTFDTDGGSEIPSQTVKKGEKVTKPDTPEKAGYEFAGWYVDDEEWSFIGYTVTEDMTITAKWVRITYDVRFVDENGTLISTQKVEQNGKIAKPADPVKEGCFLVGWFKGGVAWNFDENTVTSDITLKTKWVAYVTYYTDGGINNNPDKIYSDDNLPIALNAPTKDGYTFLGWYTDPNFTNKIESLSSCAPYILYALWSENPPVIQSKYPWEHTTITIQINEDSDASQLPSSSRRYLAGDITGCENDRNRIDDYVTDRNNAAISETNVTVQYQYLPDGANYGWGQNVNFIYEQVMSYDSSAPDIFVNFVYDMVAASLKGAFANLYSTTMYHYGHELYGSEHNYFEFEDNLAYQDTGDRYMLGYMKSLTLSKYKMYCLASDYFTDLVRASAVIPVNIGMLEQYIIPTTEEGRCNTDREGDGKYTIDDFYELVWDMEWTYETLADFSSYVALEQDCNEGTSVTDRIGFALDTSSSHAAAGMLYGSSVTIIERVYDPTTGDYTHSYPNIQRYTDATGRTYHSFDVRDFTCTDLIDFCNNLSTLMWSDGIITVSIVDALNLGYSNTGSAIRTNFANGNILFGGIVPLGTLEHEDYLSMKGEGMKGYGIAPVPLYRSNSDDHYLTHILNNAKIGAISRATKKFAQCTAYLNYQSLNSSEVLEEYYNFKLKSSIQGTDANTEMLDYIRANVRGSLDATFEDALGEFYKSITSGTSTQDKWHVMLKNRNYQFDDLKQKYAEVTATKADRLYKLETEIYPLLPN